MLCAAPSVTLLFSRRRAGAICAEDGAFLTIRNAASFQNNTAENNGGTPKSSSCKSQLVCSVSISVALMPIRWYLLSQILYDDSLFLTQQLDLKPSAMPLAGRRFVVCVVPCFEAGFPSDGERKIAS